MKRDRKSNGLPLVFELGPTTWKVLISLLAVQRPIGPREVARRLGMSSHTVAIYHLEKLCNENVVEKNIEGEYHVKSGANLGFLDNFLYIRDKTVPRVLFYAVVITGLVVFYITAVGIDYSIHSLFTLTIGIISMVFFWVEVYRTWTGLV
ncbi:MAG: hypothetical protein ACFFED_06690 [Candidatus Thorarchaeota archaeon]